MNDATRCLLGTPICGFPGGNESVDVGGRKGRGDGFFVGQDIHDELDAVIAELVGRELVKERVGHGRGNVGRIGGGVGVRRKMRGVRGRRKRG